MFCFYQDVSFQKEPRFDGDADAGLAVALHVTVKEKNEINKVTGAETVQGGEVCFVRGQRGRGGGGL